MYLHSFVTRVSAAGLLQVAESAFTELCSLVSNWTLAPVAQSPEARPRRPSAPSPTSAPRYGQQRSSGGTSESLPSPRPPLHALIARALALSAPALILHSVIAVVARVRLAPAGDGGVHEQRHPLPPARLRQGASPAP